MRRGLLDLSVGILLLAVVASNSCDRPVRCEMAFRKQWSEVLAALPVDRDQDGRDELYILHERILSIMELNGVDCVSGQPNFLPAPPGLVDYVGDLDGDGRPEVLLSSALADTVWLCVHHLSTGRVDTVTVEIGVRYGNSVWDGGVERVALADLDGDGKDELVVGVSSGYGGRPRGVYAFSLNTHSVIWKFLCGPQVKSIAACDFDGDGRSEIAVGGHGVCNGCVDNGMSDFESYVFLLDGDGGLVWKRMIHRGSSHADIRLADMDGDSVPEIVVRGWCALEDAERSDSILILDAADGNLKEAIPSDSGAKLWRFEVSDLDGDGRPEVVVVDSRGVMEVWDRDLRVVARREFAEGIYDILACDRLFGTRQRQLVVSSTPKELLVLDHRLRTVVRRTFSESVQFVRPVAAGEGKPMGLMVVSEVLVPSGPPFREMELYSIYLFPRPFPWMVVSIILAVLLFGVLFLVFYFRRSYREQIRYLARGLVQKAGVVELDRKGCVSAANEYARKLLGIETEVRNQRISEILSGQEFVALREALKRVLSGKEKQAGCEMALEREGVTKTHSARVSRVRFGGYLLSIEDLSAVEYARRIADWGPVARRMAHGIKNPLTTIALTVQRLERHCDPEAERYTESLKEDIERLRKMTDGFMRFTTLESPALESADLNDVLSQALAKVTDVVPDGISIRRELEENLPPVALDRKQMGTVFANVIENAIAAMGENGTLTVTTRLPDSPAGKGHVVIEIADTGKGIPKRYLDKVFDPYFTRKPGGTGLGMSITKRIVEDHKGTISIASVEGEGTTVTIVLPVTPTTGTSAAQA